ncbi:MAG: hypothetical protein HKN30_11150 [Sulfitobacter sp.]|nr:hypothetical protein [Sulfitobacter sp.]
MGPMNEGGTPPFTDLLGRVAEHLDHLANEAHLLEQAVCDAWDTQASGDPAAVQQLQRLDFLRQSLEDCALLTHLLSRLDTAAPKLDPLIQKLRLESTRALFAAPAAPGPPAPPSGEVDLF